MNNKQNVNRFGGFSHGLRYDRHADGDGQETSDSVPHPLPGVRRQEEDHTAQEHQQHNSDVCDSIKSSLSYKPVC